MKWSIVGVARLVGLAASLPVALAAGGAQQPQTGHGAEAPHMPHRFDDAERYAKSFDDPGRDDWQMPGRVIEQLDVRAGQTVADIGAGTGYFTVRLARGTPARTVYAVDVEPAMVDHVRKRAAAEGLGNVVAVLATADATKLPEPVDLVLVVNTFHHIPNRVAYFTALRGAMTPRARLAIVDYRKGAAGEGPPEEFRFTPEQIGDELRRAGFELLARHDFLPRQSFLIFGIP